MPTIEPDSRSAARRALDEQIAAEPHLSSPEVSPGAAPVRVEDHLHREARHPLALPAIVENGIIRLIDRGITLPERSRVIVVAEGT